MKRQLMTVIALMAACAGLGEAYDPAKHGNPIVVTSGAVDIDGNGAVIDAKGLARCATLGPNVTIRNFVLKNGKAELGGGVCGGKAVNCTITGCQATESGAALWGCTAENCTITGNEFANGSSKAAAHGGILFGSTLTGCTITGNTVTFGSEAPAFGGVGEKTVISGGSFSDNTVTCERMVCYGTYFYDSTIGETTALYWDDDPFATPGGDDDPPGGDDDPPGPTPDPQPDPSSYTPEPDSELDVGEGMVDRHYKPVYLNALGTFEETYGTKVTLKAEGLPKGLKLVKTAVKDGKTTVGYTYWIEGVPTEIFDGMNRIAYVRITDATNNKEKKVTLIPLAKLRIVPATVATFPPATNKVAYWHFPLRKIWRSFEGNEKNWTFSGWPTGIKYTTRLVTSKQKIDGVNVLVTNALPYEIYGTPTKVGTFTVKAVEKIAGTSYKSTHVATFTVWPDAAEPGAEKGWTDQAYVELGEDRVSRDDVTAASGLPTGVKFAAKDVFKGDELVTKGHHFYGTPTKAGTYAVTLTYEDNSKTQFLWTITPADAPAFELKLTETSVDPLTAKATIRQGVAYEWAVTNTLGSKVSASGLPSGLSLKSTAIKDGKTTIGYAYSVKGVPTKAGEYVITFKTTLNGVTTVTTAAFTVLDLPAWAQGTFDGGADETFPSGGQATLTLSKVGKLSGKWMSLGTNWTLSAASYDRYDKASESYVAQMIGKTGSGKTAALFTNELTVAADGLGGIATNDLFIAYQNNWKLEPWKTVGKAFSKAKELVFVPEGYETNDTVSLKFATSGKVTVKGKFVKSVSDKGKITWYSVSGSAVLCPQTEPGANDAFGGYVFVYLPPKAKTPLEDGGYAVCVPVVWDGMKFDIWKFDEE